MAQQPDPAANSANLLDLYKIAVDEYRFNVRLGWDRTRFFLGLHTALGGAAVALARAGGNDPVALTLLSVVGVAAAVVGFRNITQSHYYYRRAVFKKTLIEDRLGLTRPLAEYDNDAATLAIGTTQTQADVEPILRSTDAWLHRKTRFQSVVGNLKIFFGLMGFLHAANLIWQVSSVLECPCI